MLHKLLQSHIWQCSDYTLITISNCEKKAVRVIAKQPPWSHSNPIFLSLNLLKVTDFYKYNLGVYMWNNEAIFAQNFWINVHNTRSGDHYVPSYQRIPITFNQSIMRQVPHNWEHIPVELKNLPSLKSFK